MAEASAGQFLPQTLELPLVSSPSTARHVTTCRQTRQKAAFRSCHCCSCEASRDRLRQAKPFRSIIIVQHNALVNRELKYKSNRVQFKTLLAVYLLTVLNIFKLYFQNFILAFTCMNVHRPGTVVGASVPFSDPSGC